MLVHVCVYIRKNVCMLACQRVIDDYSPLSDQTNGTFPLKALFQRGTGQNRGDSGFSGRATLPDRPPPPPPQPTTTTS